jgi:hypothetical protein
MTMDSLTNSSKTNTMHASKNGFNSLVLLNKMLIKSMLKNKMKMKIWKKMKVMILLMMINLTKKML